MEFGPWRVLGAYSFGMGICLTNLANDNDFLLCNFWNWRPTAALVEHLLATDPNDPSRFDRFSGGAGMQVSEGEAKQMATFLFAQVLPKLRAGQRISLDGTILTEPDDGTFYTEPEQQHFNYSAQQEWLEQFATFCQNSSGFSVY